MPTPIQLAARIEEATPPPTALYRDPVWFRAAIERIFARTWHAFPEHLPPPRAGLVQPWNLLAGSLDEPLVLTCDDDGMHLLSNACTYRGARLVHRVGNAEHLISPHHDRRYSLAGHLLDTADRGDEDLPSVDFGRLGPLLLAALSPAQALDELVAPVAEHLGELPFDTLTPDPDSGRDYHVAASWLHCVDDTLTHGTDSGSHLQLLPRGRLVTERRAAAEATTPTLDLPKGHPDHDTDVVAYRAWLMPTTELHVFAWGVTTRVTVPLTASTTRIVLRHYTWNAEARPEDHGALLDATEHAAQNRVEAVASGQRGRLWRPRRYQPERDRAVHHGHRLIADLWNDAPAKD